MHKFFSVEEISQHRTEESCWVVMKDAVYDLTAFLEKHPGGAATILNHAGGNDAFHAFEAIGHSNHAKSLLHSHRIGVIYENKKDENTKIFVEDPKKIRKASSCPFHRERRETETKDTDNIWLRDNGGRLVGDFGNKFGPGHFSFQQFIEFISPTKLVRERFLPANGMNEKPYWCSDDPEESNLRDRASRFNLFKEWIFLMFLIPWCGLEVRDSRGHENQGGAWENTSQVLDFVVLMVLGAAVLSSMVYSNELATKSHMIRRFIESGELLTAAASFFTCLVSFIWVVKSASWSNFTVLRSAPVFVLACYLMWPLKLRSNSGKKKDENGTAEMMSTMYRGVVDRRISRGIGILIAPMVELVLLQRAENPWYDILALFVFGFSLVSLNFFCGLAVKTCQEVTAKRSTNVMECARDSERVMRCAFALAFVTTAILMRLILFIWYPLEGMAMPLSYDDLSTHVSILSSLLFCFCLRNGIDAVIVSAHIDTLTCRIHLLSALFAGPIAALTLMCYVVLTILNGLVSWTGLTCFVVWYGSFHINRYLQERSTNSVKRINTRDPIGKHCRDMCDESLTYKELQAELGMTSLYALLTQFMSLNMCMRPASVLVEIASSLLVGNLRYYAHETPVIDFRDTSQNVKIGVAYCVTPPNETQRKPHTFVCNVGHMKFPEAGNADWITTNMHTYRMVESLARDSRAGIKGFVSQVIAEFHLKDQEIDENGKKVEKRYVRQVNLSAWDSEKSAHDWYVASRAHRDIVKMLKNGKSGSGALSSFSSLLAHLSPTPGHRIRWFAKCMNCGGLQTKYPDIRQCPKCAKDVKIRAYF